VERTLAYLDSLPAATRSLSALRPDAMALAHTAVSYLTGFTSEPALLDRLNALAGARAFTTARAVIAALQHLGVRRLALATPYPAAISEAGRAYWQAAGFELVAYRRLEGVSNIYDETEERAYDLGRAVNTEDADAVLISGTGLPTAGIVERLERDLGKPVVTSQAATLWHALRLMSVADRVPGYGRLLSA